MFDAVVPIVMHSPSDASRLDDKANTIECPGCSAAFAPKRSNQRYCSSGCQRRSSRNSSRGSRSTENRQRSRRHYERVHRLTEMIYSAPPQERLGVMKHILDFVPHDAGLRNILTDHELHRQTPRSDGRMNIAKAANAYTKMFFGLSIQRYIEVIRAGHKPEGIPL